MAKKLSKKQLEELVTRAREAKRVMDDWEGSKDLVREYLVEHNGEAFGLKLGAVPTTKKAFDKDAMKKDGVFDKYYKEMPYSGKASILGL